MTPFAPLLAGFLRDYMPCQCAYSPHTCDAYAHSFKRLLEFAARLTKAWCRDRCFADSWGWGSTAVRLCAAPSGPAALLCSALSHRACPGVSTLRAAIDGAQRASLAC